VDFAELVGVSNPPDARSFRALEYAAFAAFLL
jgi:hypothetical protein